LATPLGTKSLSSATMANDKGILFEIDFENIIMVKPEEMPEESQKALEEFQRALQERRKAFEEELKVVEEKEMQAFSHASRRTSKVG
jgi:hypothetical protein